MESKANGTFVPVENVVDARGLSCPQPVLLAKRAMESCAEERELSILVDSVTSRENVRRCAESNNWSSSWREEKGGTFRITLERRK